MSATRQRVVTAALAVTVSVGLVMAQATAAFAAEPEKPVVTEAEHPVKGSYLVTFAEDGSAARSAGATERTVKSLVDEYGGELGAVLTETMRGYTVSGLPEHQARMVAAHPDVAEVRQSGRAGIAGPGGTQENPQNWGLDRVDQRDLPLDDSYTYPNDGEGVTAYIVDTGIRYSHQEFDGRATFGTDLHAQPNNGEDCHNHGTHVSGIVGGQTRGVAKAADLVSVRILGCDGYGEDVDLVEAAEWITRNAATPAVVNLSVYTDDPHIATDAIQGSIASGIQWSLITGNNGGDACDYGPGGQVDEALTVGNSTSNDTKRFDSNAGTCMDLFAPGTDIDSAYAGGDSSYGTMSGTSMAAPHVAGAMALRLHDAPDASPADLETWIMENASPGKLSGLPAGTPNELLFVSNENSQPPGDPTARLEASCAEGSLSCDFDGSGSSDDGQIVSFEWDFGDRASGEGETVEHTYDTEGSYTVSLTVTDDDGNTGTTNKRVDVGDVGGGEPPEAGFTVSCQQLRCSFDGSASRDGDGSVVSHEWDFGDGGSGKGVSPVHAYPARTADYTATLTVVDDHGDSDTAQRTIRCWDFGTGQGFCFGS